MGRRLRRLGLESRSSKTVSACSSAGTSEGRLTSAGRAAGDRSGYPVDQRRQWKVRHNRLTLADADPIATRDSPDRVGVQLEMIEDPPHGVLAAGPHQDEHALLRFRQHDLVRIHATLAAADPGHIDVQAAVTAVGELAGSAGEPGRP